MNHLKKPFSWTPWLFLMPFILVFCTFTLYPLIQALTLSLHQTFGPKASVFVGLDNFSYLLKDPLFWIALKNTLIFTLASVFIQMPLALGLAILLNGKYLRGRSFFRLIFFAPSLVGMVFAGMLFGLIFEKRTGLLNLSIQKVYPGFNLEFPWLQTYIMPALILTSVWMYVGFNMVYFLAALQTVPEELLEAAEIDGASCWDKFKNVTLPYILPVSSFVVLLCIIGSVQLFELPFVMLNGSGPEDRGLTLVMYLYQIGFLNGDLGYASAIGWVIAMILLFFAYAQRQLGRRIEL